MTKRRPTRIGLTILMLVLLLTSGCSSIRSTLVTRDTNNQFWEFHKRLKGVPITLKIPTHIKVYVFDKHYLELVNVGDQQVVQPIELDVPVRDFATEFIFTDKIFTVDLKRPAAGTFNSKFDLSEDQYFEKIQHNVTDETIEQVTNLFTKLIPTGQLGIFNPVSDVGEADIQEVKSLAAVGVFELNAPDFEQQIMDFINCHINKSHDAFVVPPHAELKRVGPTDTVLPTTQLCPDGTCGRCQRCSPKNLH